MKKTFQELTIKDPFMFAATMSDEEQCKAFLEIVLKIPPDRKYASWQEVFFVCTI